MPDSGNPSKPSPSRKIVLWAWALAAFVVLMIALLFVFQSSERMNLRSRESALKIDLRTMREAIEKYTLDKRKPPKSLQDLVDANYLRSIPVDPMTNRRDWHAVLGDVPFPRAVGQGIVDIHSNSGKTSLDGAPYDIW